jgi:gas vesicle protein
MKAFLAGLGIGIGVGVLFAPERGEATRNKLRGRIANWWQSFTRQAEAASDAYEKNSDHVSGRKGAGRETASSANTDVINTLSREELLKVNGIGPVLADKIISNRPYSARRELVERSILPLSTYEELERELRTRERRSAR